MTYLDGIVRQLGLTFLDSNEPDVSTFTPNAVPIAHGRRRAFDPMSKDGVRSPHSLPRKCTCIPIPPNSSIATDHFSSSWSFTPPWDPSWSTEEMHKEACRRICWSALNLVARYTSHCIAFQKEPTDLFLTDPSNVCIQSLCCAFCSVLIVAQFRLLFPGEVSERGSNEHKTQSPKDSIWALYCRSMLLWNFCTTRLRKNVFNSTETAELALEAWSETLEIQDALDAHTCNLDVALLYMSREYMYKYVTFTFSLVAVDGNGFLQHADHDYSDFASVSLRFCRFMRGADGGVCSVHADSASLPQFNRKLAEQWRK